MSMTSFAEVRELSSTKFADCPLGKALENNASALSTRDMDKPLGIVYENFKNCPSGNGQWEGERGDSKWIPDPDYTPPEKSRSTDKPYSNPDNLSWTEILDKYDIDGINFKDGEPDFGEIRKGEVAIEPYTSDRDDNFDLADIALAKEKGCAPSEVKTWRSENNYTWHECKDMKTMQKVPNEIHANIWHSGGISELKKGSGKEA